jgi:hypothetical protein
MQLLDHADMDAGQLSTAQSYAKLLSKIGADFNQLLKKHGLTDMQIDSFSFKKRTGLDATAKEPYPTGIGVTAEGVWVAKSYNK